MAHINSNVNDEKRGMPRAYQPGGMYPTLSAPPRYDEIMAGVTSKGSNGVNCISRFGKYGEISTQPGAFRSPTKISVSPDGKAVVVDPANKTVQVFLCSSGECLSLIRGVEGVNGCCLVKDGSLAVATTRGMEVYNSNGTLVKKVAMGPVVNAIRYGGGFIAVQPRALVAFKDMSGGTSQTLADMSKPGQFRQPIGFQNITDVAINSQQDIIVLDAGSIYTLTEDGFIKSVINPSQEPCAALKNPTAIATDQSHNILVSDTGNQRVLLFGANGRYRQTIYERQTDQSGGPMIPTGLDVSQNDQVFIVTKGEKSAEVVALKYL
jgi:hypothetical protein